MVRPIDAAAKRSTIILRDVPSTIPEDEIRALFDSKLFGDIDSLRRDIGCTDDILRDGGCTWCAVPRSQAQCQWRPRRRRLASLL